MNRNHIEMQIDQLLTKPINTDEVLNFVRKHGIDVPKQKRLKVSQLRTVLIDHFNNHELSFMRHNIQHSPQHEVDKARYDRQLLQSKIEELEYWLSKTKAADLIAEMHQRRAELKDKEDKIDTNVVIWNLLQHGTNHEICEVITILVDRLTDEKQSSRRVAELESVVDVVWDAEQYFDDDFDEDYLME